MFSIQVGRVFIQRIAVSHPSWVKRREVEHVCASGRRKRACTRVSSSALADGAPKKTLIELGDGFVRRRWSAGEERVW